MSQVIRLSVGSLVITPGYNSYVGKSGPFGCKVLAANCDFRVLIAKECVMTITAQPSAPVVFGRLLLTTFLLPLACALILTARPVRAQTFTVLHTFSGGEDGGNPYSGVTLGGTGNLYGTAENYGRGFGTVYRLQNRGSGWTFSTLFAFSSGSSNPFGGVVFGPNGLLYGTTGLGNSNAAYDVRPPATFCRAILCPWSYTALFTFTNLSGREPTGNLAFDQSGNIYGTTYSGGLADDGIVYELTPPGNWCTENVLESFIGPNGTKPSAGVILDSAGDIYGTAAFGGPNNSGVVFQLVPSEGQWTDRILYDFPHSSDGVYLFGGLILDQLGNLYGATVAGGANNSGTVFELSPSGGGWTFNVLFSFSQGEDGPWASLSMDGAGNIYGTTHGEGAYGKGNVFKLSPSNGGWTYTDLYDFTGGADGANPVSNVAIDASGNLYGTTYNGGEGSCEGGCGVVWEITP
jgi:uncharacterized repeat protein (TIGR03803 family)